MGACNGAMKEAEGEGERKIGRRRGDDDEDDCDGCGRRGGAGRLVTRNVMALPTARGALKGPRAGVFSAKLVMRTLYDTARRAARARTH